VGVRAGDLPPAPRRRRVLVVDDDAAVRGMFAAVLRADGFDVAAAPDGLAALDLLRRERFAVVLVDYAMPRLDGLAMLRRLHETGFDTPVIFVSGSLEASRESEAQRLGAVAVLSKPPDLHRLLRLCHELSGRASALPHGGG
jgi:CheY-like chemotaxis protein